MSNANIGWLFNKDYFNGLDYTDLAQKKNVDNINAKVKAIIQSTFIPNEEEILGSTRFQGTTAYPGLILGAGNTHELPSIEGQAILGFYFDYTSGLPVIAGSSIKGVLKSAFKHPQYIQALLDDENMDIKALEDEIFENADIFYDAYIIKADTQDRLLGDDYITPHADPLKDPVPLRFIKVLPEVTFLFQFELDDGKIVSKKKKETLFRNILADLGLGAKTNVGYGKFTISDAPKTEAEVEAEKVAMEKAEAEKKAREEAQREKEKADKEAKKEEGLNALLDCKTLADGFKLLKDSFGKKPKLTAEETKIVQQYYNKQKNLSKSDMKVFKKYGIS
ncbi:MAG: type III-B CRISPR module RAMP protein Cmr6 [Epsilonproteobacteria bacterium]|nr:type III-B CRISPR module RAMP protein Cmr6 [Campylobacterota bacterium]